MKHTTTVVNTVLVILVTLTVNLVIYLSFYRERRVVDIQLNAAIPLATGSPTVQIDKTQADKVLREIIVDQVQSEANKVISLVNFPITIFSILMTLLALLFGSVTVRTITEARDLLARIEKEPETLLQTYFRNQLPLLFQKVFDPNPIMRVETIKQLAQNTEINQTHFDMLRSVVEKEVSEGAGIFTYSNLALLIPLLYKLDPKRTSDLLFGFLEQSHGLQATSLLVSFTVSTSENANDPRIRRLLLNASPQEGTTIVSQLLFAAKPNSDLIGFILSDCRADLASYLFSYSVSQPIKISSAEAKSALLRRANLEAPIVNMLAHGTQNILDLRDVYAILVHYSKQSDATPTGVAGHLSGLNTKLKSSPLPNFSLQVEIERDFTPEIADLTRRLFV